MHHADFGARENVARNWADKIPPIDWFDSGEKQKYCVPADSQWILIRTYSGISTREKMSELVLGSNVKSNANLAQHSLGVYRNVYDVYVFFLDHYCR